MTWAPCPHGVRTRGKKDHVMDYLISVTDLKVFGALSRYGLTAPGGATQTLLLQGYPQ